MTITKLTLTENRFPAFCPTRVTYHKNDKQAFEYARRVITYGKDEMVNGELKHIEYRNEYTIEHYDR